MMSIEILIDKINGELNEYETSDIPSPATDTELVTLKKEMREKFNYTIPLAFEKLLSYSNGVLFNGLIIWPTQKYWLFQESFAEANSNLRETFNEDYFYFGNRDEELYVFNPNTDTYQGIEYIGDTAWIEFNDSETMLEFMLNRSLEE